MWSFSVFALLLVIIVAPSLCSSAGQSLLVWKRSNESASHETDYLIEQTNQRFYIDASASNQINVKLADYFISAPVITIMCHVMDLTPSSTITAMNFCCLRPGSISAECYNLLENKRPIFSTGVRFDASTDKMRGASITTDWGSLFPSSTTRTTLSGIYYCEFTNYKNTLRSASIEIQDLSVIYQEIVSHENKELQVIPRGPIIPDELPLTLPCPGAIDNPLASQMNIPSELGWKLCIISSSNGEVSGFQCQNNVLNSQVERVDTFFSKYIVHSNGSITILRLNHNKQFNNYVLICHELKRPTRFYGIYAGPGSNVNQLKPLVLDGTQPYTGLLLPISPTYQVKTIRAGKYSASHSLVAYYKANFDRVRARWYKLNDRLVSEHLDEKDIFQYNLGNEITKSLAGTYKLELDYGLNSIQTTFTFVLQVNSPPALKKPIASEVFLMEKSNYVVSVEFNDAEAIDVSINGQSVVRNNIFLKDDLKSLLDYSGLASLQTDIQPMNINPQLPFNYSVTRISPTDTHVVTFQAQNTLGMVSVNHALHVVPKPKFSKTPALYNCSMGCTSDQIHTFRCSFDSDNYKSILATSAHVNMFWTVGGDHVTEASIRSDKYLSVFTLTTTQNGDSELVLSSINSTEVWVKEVYHKLQKTYVECVIEIHKPGKVDKQGTLLYTSLTDNEIKHFLKTPLHLRPPAGVAQASASWIWVIIVICILVVIVGLILCYKFVHRSMGNTYSVDEKERETGIDPEREIKEKEAFHSYERDGESRDRLTADQSGCLYDMDSDSEEDARRGMDPEEYDEAGSFIMQYTGTQHSRQSHKTNGHLPHVSKSNGNAAYPV